MEEPRRREPTDFGRMGEEELKNALKDMRFNPTRIKTETKEEKRFLTPEDLFKKGKVELEVKVKFPDWKTSHK